MNIIKLADGVVITCFVTTPEPLASEDYEIVGELRAAVETAAEYFQAKLDAEEDDEEAEDE